MPNYEYHVFLSYKRGPYEQWVDHHFLPRLKDYLAEDLAEADVRVFVDREKIDPGTQWRDELAIALRQSRCLVALWSPLYFQSRNCVMEWQSFALRSKLIDKPLFVPITIHDGASFPDAAKATQYMDFKKFNWSAPAFANSLLYLEFEEELKKLSAKVAEVVRAAPDYRDDWPIYDGELPAPPRIPLVSFRK